MALAMRTSMRIIRLAMGAPFRRCPKLVLRSSAACVHFVSRVSARSAGGPPAAQRAIELDDGRELALTKPRERELTVEEISLRVEHGQVAVEPAAIPLASRAATIRASVWTSRSCCLRCSPVFV